MGFLREGFGRRESGSAILTLLQSPVRGALDAGDRRQQVFSGFIRHVNLIAIQILHRCKGSLFRRNNLRPSAPTSSAPSSGEIPAPDNDLQRWQVRQNLQRLTAKRGLKLVRLTLADDVQQELFSRQFGVEYLDVRRLGVFPSVVSLPASQTKRDSAMCISLYSLTRRRKAERRGLVAAPLDYCEKATWNVEHSTTLLQPASVTSSDASRPPSRSAPANASSGPCHIANWR